jgi:hypothetical protein
MTPFLFGVPWFYQAWQHLDAADVEGISQRPARSWRLFSRRRAEDPAPSPADRPGDSPTTARAPGRTEGPESGTEVVPWPYPQLLLPVTEDELITFGRELQTTSDVVGRLLAEC